VTDLGMFTVRSNHPPLVMKNIPGLEPRLVQNSCSEEVFLQAVPDYQMELDRGGYNYKLSYDPPVRPTHPPVRKRGSRRIPWFNPPYSLDMGTNVAKDFLELVDKHFPPGLIFYSICNRSSQIVSYRSLPNKTSLIAIHNS
jgi:hypothetical protein